LRLAVWSPLPPSPSGIADYVAEQLPFLARHADVVPVAGAPESAIDADLHLYHLGNSPAHAFVYQAALERPGVAFLHDSNLHHLVLHETVERGDTASYLREMRRAHGETGSFVARQVARALGGDLLPALFPLSERVLERSLGVVGLTRHVCSVAAGRLPGRPILQLPHHAFLPFDPVPSREEARRVLGIDASDFVVTCPGLATAAKRLDAVVRVAGRLLKRDPRFRLVIAGGVDPRLPLHGWAREAGLRDRLTVSGRVSLEDFVRHLAAADVVLALRFPSHGEMSGALVRALAVGRPVLVSSGSTAANELPEGIVAPVDPGPGEEPQLEALLERLREDAPLRDSLGRLARAHAHRHLDPGETVLRLGSFLRQVLDRKAELESAVAAERSAQGGLLGYLLDEVRGAARELGLPGAHVPVTPLLRELVGGRP
jgi:glycosyltransferase involved in cell wall biosynthesis